MRPGSCCEAELLSGDLKSRVRCRYHTGLPLELMFGAIGLLPTRHAVVVLALLDRNLRRCDWPADGEPYSQCARFAASQFLSLYLARVGCRARKNTHTAARGEHFANHLRRTQRPVSAKHHCYRQSVPKLNRQETRPGYFDPVSTTPNRPLL